MSDNLPTTQGAISRDLIKEIAMDIGKEVSAYIEIMYPEAVKACSSTFLLSLRNHTYNEIMAALELTDEQAILRRLEDRRVFRRRWKKTWKALRERDWESVRNARDVPTPANAPMGDNES